MINPNILKYRKEIKSNTNIFKTSRSFMDYEKSLPNPILRNSSGVFIKDARLFCDIEKINYKDNDKFALINSGRQIMETTKKQ